MSYLPEFLPIVVAHGLAVASPGPDFAIVLRQSLRHGRRTAVWTSIGIGSGLSVHLTYCLLGLGLFLQKSAMAIAAAKYLGAAYLAWIGVQALRAQPRTGDVDLSAGEAVPTAWAAWTTGFLVNLLNPKAIFFLLAFTATRISPQTPKFIQVGYAGWMVVTTALWFSFVSVVFTREEVRRSFLRHGHWIDRALGVVFLGLAASLAFATLK